MGLLGDFLALSMDGSESLQDRKRREMRDKKEDLEKIADFYYSADVNTVQTEINNFVSRAMATKKGIFASQYDKQMLTVLKEKIEFGIMKLRTLGKNVEADFFQKKFDQLK